MLKIKDLAVSKELDTKAMAGVAGGLNPFAVFDASFRSDNKVVDMDQIFDLKLSQVNGGNVINNQAIAGDNGRIGADVDQRLDQDNLLAISGQGNSFIS